VCAAIDLKALSYFGIVLRSVLTLVVTYFERWNVSSLRNTGDMFSNTTVFNQNLCPWGNVIRNKTALNVTEMFDGATGCASQASPNMAINPAGPFCSIC
jgi:Mycoplasma protein of unknown function, DUF285